jgi:hypothetical protein
MWRPAAGVMLVGALAFAVSAQGGPRAESTRDRGKSESATRVTGPAQNLQVVAGDPDGSNFEFKLEPRFDIPGGGNYNTGGLYNNSNIGPDNTVSVNSVPAGSRVYWNLILRNWDPDDDRNPALRNFQARIDDMGMMTGDGGDLTRCNDVVCTASSQCTTAFGEGGSVCPAGPDPRFCNYAWVNKSATREDADDDRFRADLPQPDCDNPVWDVGLVSPVGPLFFGSNPPEPCGLKDPHKDVYGGTYCMIVPTDAAGTYTIGYLPAETFATDPNSVLFVNITYTPGILTIPTGSCCYDLGPAGQCADGVTQSECIALEGGPICASCFQPNVLCADRECPSCLTNADCNDNDLCTNDICTAAVCSNPPVASWDQLTECCDAATGAQCTPMDPNTCANAACSLPPNRGTCAVTPVPAGQPCKGDGDDNPCTFNDVCDGTGADTCMGTDVNGQMIPCTTDADCLLATGLSAASCVSGFCNCTLVPDLTIDIDESGKADPNCFDSGDAGAKVVAHVHVAAATAPINGGQFLITYDPTCLDYNSATGVAPYTDQVYGPIVDEAAGTIFTVVGVGFGVGDGPAGNADMVDLSFTKIGDCNSCQICFSSNNPQNTYLVDNTGQRVGINPVCSKVIVANNEITISGPPEYTKRNVDCGPLEVAHVTWDAPSVDDSCGNSTLSCTCITNEGVNCDAQAMNGGVFGVGVSNICCTATSDWCDKTAEECWTVEVNDQIGLDIVIALSPTQQSKPGDDLTRCIKFSLYKSANQDPFVFEQNVTFGGLYEYIGKSADGIKIPATGNWDCITAWDQLHTLRSCYLFDYDEDCVDGRLHADFRGDPLFGGNWLIGGNLDGWKKNVEGSEPSLFVIDVLDYGTFVSQWGVDYGSGDTPCGTPGPNADINGDGLVTLEDYAFISMNFLASAKECCYPGTILPAGLRGITEISVRELRERGLGDLAAGDVNGDGMLNLADMDAFMQGARPDGKGIRGVRKGSGTR